MTNFYPVVSKYRKSHRNLFFQKGISSSNLDLSTGKWGLKVKRSFIITPAQLEVCRRVIKRRLGNKVSFKINVFCSIPKTKKPTEVRMGKGKGNVVSWVFPVYKGQILFEFFSGTRRTVNAVVRLLVKKIPVSLLLIEQ